MIRVLSCSSQRERSFHLSTYSQIYIPLIEVRVQLWLEMHVPNVIPIQKSCTSLENSWFNINEPTQPLFPSLSTYNFQKLFYISADQMDTCVNSSSNLMMLEFATI